MKWNRKYAGLLAGVMVVMVTMGGIGYRVVAANADGNEQKKEQDTESEESVSRFTEEGTTQIKTEN